MFFTTTEYDFVIPFYNLALKHFFCLLSCHFRDFDLLNDELADINIDMEQFGFIQNLDIDTNVDETVNKEFEEKGQEEQCQCPNCGFVFVPIKGDFNNE